MRRMGLIKRGLAAALCCMLCVPAAGMLWEPVVVNAVVQQAATPSDADIESMKINAKNELDDYYDFRMPSIPENKREEARKTKEASQTSW